MREAIAWLGEQKVWVMMLKSDNSLTVYPYVDEETFDMTVLCGIPKQKYLIDTESGMIELKPDFRSKEKLLIKPFLFDEITYGKWD
jgi:hypothetical protein